MNRRSVKSVCLVALAVLFLAGITRAQSVVAAYQNQMEIQTLATVAGNPTQMAWGPDGRLYLTTAYGDVLSYAYNATTGALTDAKIAVPHVGGLGIAFHGQNLYVSTFSGLLKLDDKNGNGVWGESAGELNVPIVTGIPVGDHDVDQIQIQGEHAVRRHRPRTINGYRGR